MRVYHFTSSKHAYDAVTRRQIKIAELNNLNDPFELQAPDVSDRQARRRFQKWKANIGKKYGIICFCASWENPLMWSHYADKHQGICFGFEVPDDHLTQVRYRKRRPILDTSKTLGETALNDLLYLKAEGWAYEKEFRFFTSLDKAVRRDGLHFERFSDSLRLREIIAGPLCTTPKSHLDQAAEAYPDKITIIKARLAFRSFRIVRNRQGFRE